MLYMFMSDSRWIKEAWKQETRKESNSVKDEIILMIQQKVKTGQLNQKEKNWKMNSNQHEEERLEHHSKKEVQSEIYKKKKKKYKKCNIWLEQNLTPRKTSALCP